MKKKIFVTPKEMKKVLTGTRQNLLNLVNKLVKQENAEVYLANGIYNCINNTFIHFQDRSTLIVKKHFIEAANQANNRLRRIDDMPFDDILCDGKRLHKMALELMGEGVKFKHKCLNSNIIYHTDIFKKVSELEKLTRWSEKAGFTVDIETKKEFLCLLKEKVAFQKQVEKDELLWHQATSGGFGISIPLIIFIAILAIEIATNI